MPPAESNPLTAVICHYNPTGNPFLRRLVALGVAALQQDADPGLTVIVADGSPDPDRELAARLAGPHTRYLHAGRSLSFGATYNFGVAAAGTEVVVLLANDVIIAASQLRRLAAALEGNVACAIPYLTRSDYPTQLQRRRRVPKRCLPASMTFNVNAFRRDRLRAAGDVPEELSGFFNDVILFHRLRGQGDAIALVDVGEVDHLRAVTRRISSNTRFDQDCAAAPALAPDLFAGIGPGTRNLWAHLYARSAQKPLARRLWGIVARTPRLLDPRRGLPFAVAMLEPYVAADRSGNYRVSTRSRPLPRSRPV